LKAWQGDRSSAVRVAQTKDQFPVFILTGINIWPPAGQADSGYVDESTNELCAAISRNQAVIIRIWQNAGLSLKP
jgi:hypothetical protein